MTRAIYDEAKHTLAVSFSTGRTYLYFNVPMEIYTTCKALTPWGAISTRTFATNTNSANSIEIQLARP